MAIFSRCPGCGKYSWDDAAPCCDYERARAVTAAAVRIPDYEGINAGRKHLGAGRINVAGRIFNVRSKSDIQRAHDTMNRHFERTGQARRVSWREDI